MSLDDASYIAYQYADSERLRVRMETHRLYSERPDDLVGFVLDHLAPAPGHLVADLGCGPGQYHRRLAARGARVAALDSSAGMAAEARRQAAAAGLPVEVVLGDLVAIPLRDGTCDRAMANHVLYHVRDIPAALREIGRIVRPGGRLVLTANGADTMAALHRLHAEAARAAGYSPLGAERVSFTLADLPLVRDVFPRAEAHVRQNALVFASAEPFLRYYASGSIDALADRPPDGSHRPKLLGLVRTLVEAIVARDGAFRLPKSFGCFVVDRAGD